MQVFLWRNVCESRGLKQSICLLVNVSRFTDHHIRLGPLEFTERFASNRSHSLHKVSIPGWLNSRDGDCRLWRIWGVEDFWDALEADNELSQVYDIHQKSRTELTYPKDSQNSLLVGGLTLSRGVLLKGWSLPFSLEPPEHLMRWCNGPMVWSQEARCGVHLSSHHPRLETFWSDWRLDHRFAGANQRNERGRQAPKDFGLNMRHRCDDRQIHCLLTRIKGWRLWRGTSKSCFPSNSNFPCPTAEKVRLLSTKNSSKTTINLLLLLKGLETDARPVPYSGYLHANSMLTARHQKVPSVISMFSWIVRDFLPFQAAKTNTKRHDFKASFFLEEYLKDPDRVWVGMSTLDITQSGPKKTALISLVTLASHSDVWAIKWWGKH